jgi:hypothetical protein
MACHWYWTWPPNLLCWAMQIVPWKGQSPIQVGWARAGIKRYSLGDNRYIRKPVDCVQFIEAVRQLGLY